MKSTNKYTRLIIIVIINILIFGVTNLIFEIKYEEVDDFIIYKLYSGLDGTYNIHGIYMHPILCFLLSSMFKIVSTINWHTIFMLIAQFICFTIIGYLLLEKHKNKIALFIYTIFASVFYTSLLLLIQYTSVAAILIATSFFIIMHMAEESKWSIKYTLISMLLYCLGLMIRMQSLLMVLPFMGMYGLYYLIKLRKKQIELKEFLQLVKTYLVLFIITILVYISNQLFYQDDLYKNYLEYNDLRVILNDFSLHEYEEYKEIYDEIGWSENDAFLFNSFNFGDENVFSKENLQKIVDYKTSTNRYYDLNFDIKLIFAWFAFGLAYYYPFIICVFIAISIISLINNKEKRTLNVLTIFSVIGVTLLFLILNRLVKRCIIPIYFLGTILLMHNCKLLAKENLKNKKFKKIVILMLVIVTTITISGQKYKLNYKIEEISNFKDLINYTNSHKENVYLYTIPSLQYRYLAYSVYEMPPQGAFSNLRVMGGWDIYTENYYDFKERYNLDGTFLDLLKNNVYLVDSKINWEGNPFHNYLENIIVFIKENYNIDVTYEKVQEFDYIYIYKLSAK